MIERKDDYTPTTEQVREAFSVPWHEPEDHDIGEYRAEFDRWLAERDATIEAAAEQRGAIKALREAAKDWRWSAWADAPRNPIAAANYTGDWIENRADLFGG